VFLTPWQRHLCGDATSFASIKAKGLPEYMNYEEAHEFAYVVCNDTEVRPSSSALVSQVRSRFPLSFQISRDVKEVLAAARVCSRRAVWFGACRRCCFCAVADAAAYSHRVLWLPTVVMRTGARIDS